MCYLTKKKKINTKKLIILGYDDFYNNFYL